MFRLLFLSVLVSTCALMSACGDDSTPTTPVTPAVQISETYAGTIGINGAATHTFITMDAGQAGATLTALSPDSAAIVSFAMGVWNGQYCAITLAKDDATTGQNLVGNASQGSFCVRVADIGRLTAPTDYVITVSHF